MKIDNLLTSTPYNNSESFNLNINIGDIITGEILSMVDKVLTIRLSNGQTIQAQNISDHKFNTNEKSEFIVSDIVDEKISIKAIPKAANISEVDFKNIKANVKNINQDLIKLLVENKFSISEENIKFFENKRKCYAKIAQFIKLTDVKNNDKILKNNIRDVIREFFIEKKLGNEISQSENNIMNDKVVDKQNTNNYNSIINNLNNVSYKKLLFMFSNNLNFNINNLVHLDNIVLGESTITKNIKEVIELFKNHTTDKIHVDKLDLLLAEYSPKDKNSIKPDINILFNKLLEELNIIRLKITDNKLQSILDEKVNNIKSGIEFINKINENFTFIQVPLVLNKNLHNLDIIIKGDSSKKKRISPNNTKLFLSLNTNHLDLVQVLIEIRNKDINLNFKVKSPLVKAIIDKNKDFLHNSLKNLGYNNIVFKFNLGEKNDNITNLLSLNKKEEINSIDMRV